MKRGKQWGDRKEKRKLQEKKIPFHGPASFVPGSGCITVHIQSQIVHRAAHSFIKNTNLKFYVGCNIINWTLWRMKVSFMTDKQQGFVDLKQGINGRAQFTSAPFTYHLMNL